MSAVDERDDAAACGGDALFFFDASMAVIEIADVTRTVTMMVQQCT